MPSNNLLNTDLCTKLETLKFHENKQVKAFINLFRYENVLSEIRLQINDLEKEKGKYLGWHDERKQVKIDALKDLIKDIQNGDDMLAAINKAKKSPEVTAGIIKSRVALLLNKLETAAKQHAPEQQPDPSPHHPRSHKRRP